MAQVSTATVLSIRDTEIEKVKFLICLRFKKKEDKDKMCAILSKLQLIF